MITAAEIRAKYPNPSACGVSHDESNYCVGGALCQFLGEDYRFPLPGEMADRLGRINPSLNADRALEFGFEIMNANEEQNFDRAWQLLDEALTWKLHSREGK